MEPPEVNLAISTLKNTSNAISEKSRYEASFILLEHGSNKATNFLKSIITTPDSPSLKSLFNAIGQYKKISQDLFNLLITQAPYIPKESQKSYRDSLLGCSKGGHQTLDALLDLIQNRELNTNEKISYINLLDLFEPKRKTASLLFELLSNQNEPVLITELAKKQFKILTGLDKSASDNSIKKWWRSNKNKSERAWKEIAVEELMTRIDLAEKETKKIKEEFEYFLRQIWPKLNQEDQLTLVKDLLAEDSENPKPPTIQIIALQRSSILLQDGRADEPLQKRIVDLIDSKNINVQFTAANLLPLIRFNGDADRISNSQSLQINSALRNIVLKAFRKRAPKQLMYLAIASLSDEPAAAEILFDLLKENKLSNNEIEIIKIKIGTIASELPSVAALQILSKVNISEKQIQEWLKSQNMDMRYKAAEALASIGDYKRLNSVASEIWGEPYYIDALSNSLKIESFEILLELFKSNLNKEKQSHLTDASIRFMSKISNETFKILISQMLPKFEKIKDSIAIPSHYTLVAKCIATRMLGDESGRKDELLINQTITCLRNANKSKEALAILQSRDSSLIDKLKDLEFQVALETREFDVAAALFNNPNKWIEAYNFMKNGTDLEKESANSLKTSILTRFEKQLDDQMLQKLQTEEKK